MITGAPVIIGVFCSIPILVGIGVWLYRRDEQRDQELRERVPQLTMLYEDMSVDKAQAIVWKWEEMTEDERVALPLERRVEVRKIREDLAAHKKRWKLE